MKRLQYFKFPVTITTFYSEIFVVVFFFFLPKAVPRPPPSPLQLNFAHGYIATVEVYSRLALYPITALRLSIDTAVGATLWKIDFMILRVALRGVISSHCVFRALLGLAASGMLCTTAWFPGNLKCITYLLELN